MSPQGSGGDKTEKATPKKRRDARKKGQIYKSNDLIIALSMVMMLGSLKVLGPHIINNTIEMLQYMLSYQPPDVVTVGAIMDLAPPLILRFLLVVLPLLGVALAGGVVFNILQVGFLFSPDALKPKFSKINPMEGFKRIFSRKTVVELVKSIIKITVMAMVAYNEYMNQVTKTQMMLGVTLDDILLSTETMMDMIFGIGFKLAMALVALAPFDYFYQWRSYENDLMMTKQEVKDEYKLTEGDPQIKGRIKQKQREMSAMRMMNAVAEADVVITNPTHYAVALSYKEEIHTAPVIVAKGKDFVAQKIKEEADKYGIQKVENRQLAQYLYFFCDVGSEVPEEMYQTVAEILAYIYKLRGSEMRQGVR